MTKFVVVGLCLLVAFGQMASAVTEAPEVEQSTESPIADMALIAEAPLAPKTPTEKPPVVAQEPPLVTAQEKAAPQPHTVADFIIHPLIAFKPRQATLEEIQGKQAPATPGASAPASPATWLFGMNPAQQLGSSFSTLAGSVSGWFSDRLAAAGQQIPGLVETPVRGDSEASSSGISGISSTTTTSTTTQRPDIVVRVQQRPQRNGNRNGNGIRNGNGNGNGNLNNNNNRRRQQRPNRFNNRLDSFEEDYYEDDYLQGNRFDDDEDDLSLEQFEDEDSLELRPQQKPKQKPKRKQTQVQAQTQKQRRKFQQEEQVAVTQKRRQPATTSKKPKAPKKPVVVEQQDEEEENEEDEEANNDDDEEEDQVQDDDSQEQDFQPEPLFATTSTRRSQNQPNFIQRGQQSIISQIRQFTRGQTPGELGTTLRRTSASSPSSSGSQGRRPQQGTTFLVNRNGQTVYLAPELLGLNSSPYPYAYVQGQPKKQRVPVVGGAFPQPPLTVPVRRQGRPTQYITIPWSQLGLSPPDQQSPVSLAEGLQAQPLILNIPQSAISPVRSTSGGQKKRRPQLTPAAVPLLADASLMDIFQPPQIPPSRTGAPSPVATKPISAQPVLIAAKPVKAGGLGLPTRIRPGTIVEKAPAMEVVEAAEQPAMEATEVKQEQEAMAGVEAAAAAAAPPAEQQEFILVGDDDEPGLTRHVQPAFGDARYVSYGDFHPYFDLLHQNRRFALRKSGRSLEQPKEEVHKEEVQKEEVQKEEVPKEEVRMEEVQKEEVQKEEAQIEEVKKEEIKQEEIKKEEPQKEEIKKEEPQKEEIKQEEPKKEEIQKEKPQPLEQSKLPA